MSINGFNKIGRAIEEQGAFTYSYVTKATGPVPGTAGFFVDMNQTSGQPKYNAFAGSALTCTPLTGSGNAGVYVGPFNPSPSTKHLVRWQSNNVTGSTGAPPDIVFMLDYLGFYPLIDCDSVDPQDMDNSTPITRYTDGSGVGIVLVVTAPMTATAAMTITYTNQDGVSGQTTTFNVIPGAAIGVCATASGTGGASNNATPFVPLANGDTGVRQINSISMAASAGGFICACLVKPIAQMNVYEQKYATEKVFGIDQQMCPEIKEGAYLNFIIQRSGVLAGSLRSELLFINT